MVEKEISNKLSDKYWYTIEDLQLIYGKFGNYEIFKNEGIYKFLIVKKSGEYINLNIHPGVRFTPKVEMIDNKLIIGFYQLMLGNINYKNIILADSFYNPIKKIEIDVSELLIVETTIQYGKVLDYTDMFNIVTKDK